MSPYFHVWCSFYENSGLRHGFLMVLFTKMEHEINRWITTVVSVYYGKEEKLKVNF